MNKNISLVIIFIITLFSVVTISTYAYFVVDDLNVTNVADVNATSERNNMVFYTMGGKMDLYITLANMVESQSGTIAAEDSTYLTINFTANTDYDVVCSYDIIYEWVSEDRYVAHSEGVHEKEYTMQAILTPNEHVSEGNNVIRDEIDIADVIGDLTGRKVIMGAQIEGKGDTPSTATWTLLSKFYNIDANQDELSGRSFAGHYRVANVACVEGTIND